MRCIICNYCPDTDGHDVDKGSLIWDEERQGYVCEQCRSFEYVDMEDMEGLILDED